MALTRRRIPAPPAEVFSALADGFLYDRWVVGARAVHDVDPGWPSVGSQLRNRLGARVLTVPGRTEVLQSEPSRRLVLRAHAGPLGTARVELVVLPAGSGSMVEVDETVEGPRALRKISPVLGPVIALRNAEALRRLERLVMARQRASAGHGSGDAGAAADRGDEGARFPSRRRPGPDALVIGAGPNGLVAANVLADQGWDVLVLEAQAGPGGGVRSANYLGPGYIADICSAFYPLAVTSPVIGSFHLERYGLQWAQAPAVLAHPLADGRCALLSRDREQTAASLEKLGPGDGEAWLRLSGLWDAVGQPFLDALYTPLPPVRSGLKLARAVRAAGALRLARLGVLPVRRLAEEEFAGPGSLLLAGCAMHADLAPEAVGSAIYGWILTMVGQQHGWPVPEGGASQLTGALVRRLESRGARVECNAEVAEVLVHDGRAIGVRTADGRQVGARRAVIADVVAPRLYGGLVGWEHLPARLKDDMSRFQWDFATVKVDWALSGTVPWAAPEAARAGTVHLCPGLDDMTEYCAQIAMGRVPSRPFVLMGQMSTADPRRSPPGTESLWGYTHVPHRVRGDAGGEGIEGRWDERELETMADRIEAQVERFAPGFRGRVSTRVILGPRQLEAHNANLVGGAIGGGTAAFHQQLVFRPTPGLGRPETPVAQLYLASSSAHPGGGVHGACGANAARAALSHEKGARKWLAGEGLAAVQRFLSGPGPGLRRAAGPSLGPGGGGS